MVSIKRPAGPTDGAASAEPNLFELCRVTTEFEELKLFELCRVVTDEGEAKSFCTYSAKTFLNTQNPGRCPGLIAYWPCRPYSSPSPFGEGWGGASLLFLYHLVLRRFTVLVCDGLAVEQAEDECGERSDSQRQACHTKHRSVQG